VTLSVLETLRGKRVLITGASGFLGKVWLGHLLRDLPELGRVHLLLRPGARGATARLEDLLARSPAFWPLHEAHGDQVGAVVGRVLEPLAGDIAQPGLGLEAATLARLEGRLDAVVHLAGLTDLEPDPRRALAANVDGALHALDVARRTGAALLHVSTAYVAGRRRGAVAEAVALDAPLGSQRELPFVPDDEVRALRALEERVEAEAGDPQVHEALLAQARQQLRRHGRPSDAANRAEFFARERERWVEERLSALASERARHWGWPNTYTFTKALAERLLRGKAGDVPLTIVRPTIVESAEAFPLPGWKEGHQTSAPLVWAMTRGPLRGLPADRRLVLDVIPVDAVARGLTLLLAGLLAGRPLDAAHLGSSDVNPLSMFRAIELTNLADRGSAPGLKALLRPQAVPVGERGYRLGSLPLLRRLARGAREALAVASELVPERFAAQVEGWDRKAARAQRKLGELEHVVETFRPFVLENDCRFRTDGARDLTAELPQGERARFGFDPAALDWRRYWTEVHVPGLERWVYPDLEGRRPERGPRRPVSLVVPQPAKRRA
jgi:long-chain acyl-CoA synthetase